MKLSILSKTGSGFKSLGGTPLPKLPLSAPPGGGLKCLLEKMLEFCVAGNYMREREINGIDTLFKAIFEIYSYFHLTVASPK